MRAGPDLRPRPDLPEVAVDRLGGTPITLTGVAAVSSTEAWAVGIFGGSPEQTLAFHLK